MTCENSWDDFYEELFYYLIGSRLITTCNVNWEEDDESYLP